MGLFDRKKRVELPPLLSDEEIDAALEPPVNYQSVVDYLVDLPKLDYEKLLKVVDIYRNADKDVAKTLGIKLQPTATIDKESKAESENVLDDITFLEDYAPPVKTSTVKVSFNKDFKGKKGK